MRRQRAKLTLGRPQHLPNIFRQITQHRLRIVSSPPGGHRSDSPQLMALSRCQATDVSRMGRPTTNLPLTSMRTRPIKDIATYGRHLEMFDDTDASSISDAKEPRKHVSDATFEHAETMRLSPGTLPHRDLNGACQADDARRITEKVTNPTHGPNDRPCPSPHGKRRAHVRVRTFSRR